MVVCVLRCIICARPQPLEDPFSNRFYSKLKSELTLHCVHAVGYTVDTLQYGWLDNPVDLDESLEVSSQFALVDYRQYDCSQNYTAGASVHFRLSIENQDKIYSRTLSNYCRFLKSRKIGNKIKSRSHRKPEQM